MKIIIVGGGKIGFTIATQLTREGHDIVLIDNSRRVIKQMGEMLDILVMYGNGASVDIQREADVDHSDLLIAVTSHDEVNLMCCIIARKLGCPNTIARVRNPEYASQAHFLSNEFGLSMTINPEWAAAREMFRLTQIPIFLKRDSFAKGRAEIVEFEVREDGPLANLPLSEMHMRIKTRVLVCAIERSGEVFIPTGSFVLSEGDKIYVTAPAAELIALVRGLGIKNRRAKDVLIIGGSRIAQYLSKLLLDVGTRVKLVESNAEHSLMLAELLPEVSVVNADGSSQVVLKSENIDQMDAVITLTDMDEENLIISMYANFVGVPQVITKINRTEYNEVFVDKGIDCVISPKHLCAYEIVQYVRAMQNTSGSSVLTVHQLVDGKVEALEFKVSAHTRHLGETLASISLKPSLLIGCINRRGRIIIPGGSDTIEPGDTVIVVSTADRVIVDLNDIFIEEA